MRVRARLEERWRAIRRSRANLALVIAGGALIVMSPVWHFAVAPAIRVVANDFDSLYTYEGTLTTFVNPPGQPGVGGTPERAPVLIEQRLSGRPDLSTTSISAVQENVRTLAADTGDEISAQERILTLDRKTGELVKAAGADRVRSGYYVVFPFDTPKKDLPYWVEQTGKAVKAHFEGGRDVEGLSVNEFAVEYHNVPVGAPAGFPGTMTGAQLKGLLDMPGLAVSDVDPLELTYLGAGRRTVLVEPEAGTPVELNGVEESVSVAAGKAGAGFAVTRLVSSLRYSQSKQSVKQAAVFARDEVAKLRLQFAYIPLGLAALGIAVLLVGTFAGIKSIKGQPEKGA